MDAVTKPSGRAVLYGALMTLPLLMPGARKRYGTLPVLLGAVGLAQQIWEWRKHKRADAAAARMSQLGIA